MSNLEQEAKKYTRKKRNPDMIKPLTARRYLAGQALAGILSSSRGALNMSEVKRSAYEWADFMLEDDD
jgi:hypothetical protein|tara:strand:+ start:1220 stop:1423 length:204 start_codon:yes stop_codon:yes gene_type:complete